MRVTISIRTPLLEKLREFGGPTASRPISTAILIGLEHSTRVVTASRRPKFGRTLAIDVSGAPYPPAPSRSGTKIHWDVETVN